MTSSHISIKKYLGEFDSEILSCCNQEKYKDTRLYSIVEQRFQIQDNKSRVTIDDSLQFNEVVVIGNEVFISKMLYDNPSVEIVNSADRQTQPVPTSLYDTGVFSTLAYVVCSNHTTIRVIDKLAEPIYIKYQADFEKFYNGILIVEVAYNVSVEIVEEIESNGCVNAATNYLLDESSSLRLTSFYKGTLSSSALVYRNVTVQEHAKFDHMCYGAGMSTVVDEMKIQCFEDASVNLSGVVYTPDRNFSSVLYVDPISTKYNISVDYRHIVNDNSDSSYLPGISTQPDSGQAQISVTALDVSDMQESDKQEDIDDFIDDVIRKSNVLKSAGARRFYENKTAFLKLY